MHGFNILRPFDPNPDTLQVHEVFYTIQGEGPFSGMPAVFVRLSGCNLGCTFCDTEWNDGTDTKEDQAALALKVDNLCELHKCNLIVLTGGEPCRQNCKIFVEYLWQHARVIQVETAGTYWNDWMALCTLVVSPKTKFVHPSVQACAKHWKYVLRSGDQHTADGLPNQPTQRYKAEKMGAPARPWERDVTVWLSPCDEGQNLMNRANQIAVRESALKFGYRAQVQVHKILGVR